MESKGNDGSHENLEDNKIQVKNSEIIVLTETSVANTQPSSIVEGEYDAGDENSHIQMKRSTKESNITESDQTLRALSPTALAVARNYAYHSLSTASTTAERSPSTPFAIKRKSQHFSPLKHGVPYIQTKSDRSIRRWQSLSKDDGDQSTEPHSPYLDYYQPSLRSPTSRDSPRNGTQSALPEKRFTVWKGNNTFFLGGRIMTGSHPYQLLLSILLIFFTSLCFILIIAPFYHDIYWYQIFFCCNFCIDCFLLKTAFTEPGIYPKRILNPNNSSDIFQTKYYHLLKDRYCNTCAIIHSKRSRHCKYCNNCIEVFDHHCPVSTIISNCIHSLLTKFPKWTGNCIGLRNYSSFFGFILSLFVTLSYMLFLLFPILVFVIWKLVFTSSMLAFSLIQLGIISFYIIWVTTVYTFISALLFLHIYLCFTKQTTNEYFRQRRIKQRQALGLSPTFDQSPESSLSPTPEDKENECFSSLIHNCGNVVYSIFLFTPMIFHKFSLNLQSTMTRNIDSSSLFSNESIGNVSSEIPVMNDASGLSRPVSKYYLTQLNPHERIETGPEVINERQPEEKEEKEDNDGENSVFVCFSSISSKKYEIVRNPRQSQVPILSHHTRLLPFWQFENNEDDEQQEILLEILYNQLQHELFHSADI